MKKFILLFVFLIPFLTFSSEYIGKSRGLIIIEALYVLSSDSIEIWEKKEVYIQIKDEKVIIHDTSNGKIISCEFDDTSDKICRSFTIVYYNTSYKSLSKKLNKRYEHQEGQESWIVCCDDNTYYEYCLERRDNEHIYILEVCKFLVENEMKITDG